MTDGLIGSSLAGALSFLESGNYNIIGVDAEPEVILAKRQCSDCTYYASNVEPEFWIDE